MKSLFWFRDQYRLHDRKILNHALEYSSEIAFIAMKDPREWGPGHDEVPLDSLNAWRAGKNGDALIDACLRELLRTGWPTPRGRQNVASFLVHDLRADWTYGAEWFESQRMDYDAATNWITCMNTAGMGRGPTPLRKFNLKAQAAAYNPDGAYRKKWAGHE